MPLVSLASLLPSPFFLSHIFLHSIFSYLSTACTQDARAARHIRDNAASHSDQARRKSKARWHDERQRLKKPMTKQRTEQQRRRHKETANPWHCVHAHVYERASGYGRSSLSRCLGWSHMVTNIRVRFSPFRCKLCLSFARRLTRWPRTHKWRTPCHLPLPTHRAPPVSRDHAKRAERRRGAEKQRKNRP